jgi:hypothetical protein
MVTRSLVFVVACYSLLTSPASADIIATVGSDTFFENSGVQSLDVTVFTTASESVTAFTADFELTGGAFLNPPGTFGMPGMVGSDSIDPSSDFLIGDPSAAFLSIIFDPAVGFPDTAGVIARLNFDVNGLAPGNYEIKLSNVFAQDGATSLVVIPNNGGFTIAVPEPNSVVMLLLAGLVAFGRRSRESFI